MKKMNMIKGTAYGALFVCAGLFATTQKNQLIAYNAYQQKKKTIDWPTTAVCKYNNTHDDGEIFIHGRNNLTDWASGCTRYHSNGRSIGSYLSSLYIKNCIIAPTNRDYCAYVGEYGFFEDVCWYNHAANKLIFFDAGEYNAVLKSDYSFSGNRLLVHRQKNTIVRDANDRTTFDWSRSGKNSIFVGEKHIAEVIHNSSLVSVFSIEKEPKETFLDQGEIYRAEEAVLSPNGEMIAIASTYEDESRLFTQIIVYNTKTLQKIRTLYVAGKLENCRRIDQHERIQFSLDNKYLFMHTETKDNKAHTWYMDIASYKDFIHIEHPAGTADKLYELAGDTKTFGSITEPDKVNFFDLRKPNEQHILELDDVRFLAINPDTGAKTKAIIATGPYSELYRYTGGSFLVKEDEKYDEE